MRELEGGINGGEAGEELLVEAEGLWDTRGAGGLTDGVHAQLGSANVCREGLGGREGGGEGGREGGVGREGMVRHV